LTALDGLDSCYMNLRVKDFVQSGLLKSFSDYKFVVNLYSRDLYFIGLKSGLLARAPSKKHDQIIIKASRVQASFRLSIERRWLERSLSLLLASVAIFLGENLFHNCRYYAHSHSLTLNRKSLIH
jgi:hypothetical protein